MFNESCKLELNKYIIRFMINFDDFKKMDLRVAKITEAERIEGSNKLLKIKVNLGKEQRQIISGIADFYTPENLIGKEIIIIANLEPRIIFGNESQGMLLATDGEKPVLLTPNEEVNPGVRIR